jgi:hypothetical protein
MGEVTIMEEFLHLLCFRCPRCGSPITTSITCDQKNIEEVDGRKISLRCGCGWMGAAHGFTASRHSTTLIDPANRDKRDHDRRDLQIERGQGPIKLDFSRTLEMR